MATFPRRGFVAEIVCLVVLVTVGLCVSLPCFRSEIEFEDEGCLAYGAVRVMEGQIPNRDFVSLQPPLCYYAAAATFKLIGTSLLSLRILGLGVYLAMPLLIYGISRQFNGRSISLAAALPATILGLPYFNFVPFAVWQGNAVALMAVLAYLLALRTGAWAGWAWAAGCLTATTMLLRQDHGFYLLIALGVLSGVLRFARGQVPAGGKPAAACLNRLLLAWLAGTGLILLPWGLFWTVERAWPDVLRQLVLFPATTYAKTSSLPFPDLRAALAWGPQIINLLFFAPPLLDLLVAIWLGQRLVRHRAGHREALVTFLLVWSSLFYCQVLVRSDLKHVLITLPPFFILAGCAFRWGLNSALHCMTAGAAEAASDRSSASLKRAGDETRGPKRSETARPPAAKDPGQQPGAETTLINRFVQRRNLAGAGICCLSAGLVSVFLWLAAQECLPPRLGPADALKLKRGGLRVRGSADLQVYIEGLQNLAPSNRSILCLPYQPMLYFLCERRNPTRWNYIWPGDQTPEELQALVEQARRDPPALVVLNHEEVLRNYAPAVIDYIQRDYLLAAKTKGRLLYLPR